MKHYIFPVLLFLISFSGIAQSNKSDANIVGDVKDMQTGEHISYITIAVKNSVVGTTTDGTGHYFLKNLPTGKITLQVSGLGYKTIEQEVEIQAGQTLELNFLVEEEAFSLNELVVSANRNETNRKEASIVVGVINPKIFIATNSVCLAQGLNFQPGVRVESDCQNCGFTQVRINGLEGPYSQILIDSRPVFSALSGVYGLEQIPVNMIERVEVVRGGGSALYGANAIAGTINIITKEALSNSFSAEYNYELIGGKAPDNSVNVNTSIVTDDNKAGMYLYGTYRNRSHYDHDGDGFSELPEIVNNAIGLRSYYRLNNQSKLTLEYHNLHEYRRGGNNFERPPHEADIAEQLDHDTNGGSLAYNWFSPDGRNKLNAYSSLQHILRKSYYGTDKDPDAYGRTTNLTFVTGAQFTHIFDELLFMPAEMTFGGEYQYDDLEDDLPAYREGTLKQKTKVAGFFFQNEWKNNKWGFLLGARLDKHNLLDDPVFSPRINIKYDIIQNLSWRASYSSGFRAPQTFDEDLHVSFLNNEGVVTRNAKDLKPEYSHSFSTSFDYYFNVGNTQANLLAEGFYTRLNDVFILVQTEDNEGNPVNERRNGHHANVAGINLEGKVAPSPAIQLQFGFTFQQSRYSEARQWTDDESVAPEKKMLRTPEQYGYFTFTAGPFKQFTVSTTGTYTGKMLVPHFEGYIDETRLERTPQFFDLGLKASYDLRLKSMNLQVSGGVKNIFNSYQKDFDKGANRDAGYIYGPSLPRTAFLSLKITT
ncbi:MAG: TonB-dependent receptor [Candidatus Azobacteroides sp.]|nr:TonB-dependent receptor [Candidatus Azobacteroides sp.]